MGCWIGQFRMRKGRRRKEWRLNSPTVVKKVSSYQEDINHIYIYVKHLLLVTRPVVSFLDFLSISFPLRLLLFLRCISVFHLFKVKSW